MGKDNNVLVIRRIHVTYHLKVDSARRDVVERVFGMHADYCPVYRTLYNSIEISTELDMEDE